MLEQIDNNSNKRSFLHQNNRFLAPISIIVLISFMVLLQSGCDNKGNQPRLDTVVKPEKAEFVDRQSCRECHEKQYREWKDSHHDLAMDVATEETVLGDFNNSTFISYDLTTTFFRQDGKFIVRTDGPDGKLHDYEIRYVLGSDPLQQYMIEFPDGRIQVLDIAWDTHSREEGGQRWFHLHPEEEITPEHLFHWTRRFLNWNYMCAECHTTNLQKNYDLETDTFKTTWSEIDVGCQACHGPGSNHVEWARYLQDTGTKSDRYRNRGLEVNLKADDSHIQVEACARCHSRRNGLRKDYHYGKRFMDYYVPQILIDPLYYPDGQILDEVYVFGSFIQSEKYHQGVRCTDCHDPHTARLHTDGNELCKRCHSTAPVREFDSVILKDYDTPEHHFHKQDSPGASCVECHMPETKYMIVDPRRDHSFRIPRPDLSIKLDIPNACNRCHEDKTPLWAANKVDEWYPFTQDIRKNEIHFAGIFSAGQAGKPEAGPWLIKLAKDVSRPSIVRATALHILQHYKNEQTLHVMSLSLKDDDPLIRYEALRGLSALIPNTSDTDMQSRKLLLLTPLLKDATRAVRTEAARSMTEVPEELRSHAQLHYFEKALEEYKQRQYSIADRPEAHLNLGLLYQNLGQNDLAETSYKNAIQLVSGFIPAHFNLANLYNAVGRNRDAEQQFHKIIELEPDNGEAYYSLGLLLAEEKRLEEAVDYLEKAAFTVKTNPRVFYNWGLCLQHLGRQDDAEKVYLKALDIMADDYSVIYALVTLYLQQRKWDDASVRVKQLKRLNPDSAEVEQLMGYIRQNGGE
ncbi:MAG: tetratricopeptide repeat protein [Candidatus Scalindua sp.]|nr:tetratricopeptide repeat protein [Candidatus Scalindua sp.]